MMHDDTSCSNINRSSTTTYTHFCSSQVMLVVIHWRKTNLQMSKSARPFEVHFIFTGLSRPHGEHWGPLESNCITDTSPQWLAHRHDNCRGRLADDTVRGWQRRGDRTGKTVGHRSGAAAADISYIFCVANRGILNTFLLFLRLMWHSIHPGFLYSPAAIFCIYFILFIYLHIRD